MVDIYLRAPNQATMHAVMRATYEALAETTLAEDQPTPQQATFASGVGGWVVDDIGAFYEQTGEDGEGNPIMTPREGYHIILRWNGPDMPPVPAPLETVWRSDAVDDNGDPVPPPAWWNRVLA